MKNRHLRILLAIGLSLMWVVLGSAYDGRSRSKGTGVRIEEAAKKAVLGRNVKIKHGEEVTIKGQDLNVKFDSVLEDSRCPKDVTCVWEGDAKILLRVRRARGNPSNLELHTNGRFAQEGKYQRYVIKLVALDPYPRTSAGGKPGNYVATLLITKE